jgi:salicylate hydroxylase
MAHFAGLDVSVKETSVCVVDDAGEVILEQKVLTEPDTIIALLTSLGDKWALIAREPLPHWSVGRVSLLGDACHPLLPFLGQGANMAIEDGMVLARCLTAHADIAEAPHRYEAARLDRTSRMARASLENVSHIHNPKLEDLMQARAFMERVGTSGARHDWIYEYDAMTVSV